MLPGLENLVEWLNNTSVWASDLIEHAKNLCYRICEQKESAEMLLATLVGYISRYVKSGNRVTRSKVQNFKNEVEHFVSCMERGCYLISIGYDSVVSWLHGTPTEVRVSNGKEEYISIRLSEIYKTGYYSVQVPEELPVTTKEEVRRLFSEDYKII